MVVVLAKRLNLHYILSSNFSKSFIPLFIQDGNLVPYFPNHAVLGKRHQQSCSSVYTRDVVCIDQYGKGYRQLYLLIKYYIAAIKGACL